MPRIRYFEDASFRARRDTSRSVIECPHILLHAAEWDSRLPAACLNLSPPNSCLLAIAGLSVIRSGCKWLGIAGEWRERSMALCLVVGEGPPFHFDCMRRGLRWFAIPDMAGKQLRSPSVSRRAHFPAHTRRASSKSCCSFRHDVGLPPMRIVCARRPWAMDSVPS
jgi:hypothetical protein